MADTEIKIIPMFQLVGDIKMKSCLKNMINLIS